MKLHVRLLSFTWSHEFKVLKEGPFPAILGQDFLRRTQKRIDVPSPTFQFWVCPEFDMHILSA